jgi:hypothetical protein
VFIDRSLATAVSSGPTIPVFQLPCHNMYDLTFYFKTSKNTRSSLSLSILQFIAVKARGIVKHSNEPL